MLDSFEFVVLGRAQPAGSKTSFPHPSTGRQVTIDAARGSRSWKQEVAAAALVALGADVERPAFVGPVALYVSFYRARPKAHYGTGRNAAVLRASAPDYPTTKPDTTKLVRGLEDALTSMRVARRCSGRPPVGGAAVGEPGALRGARALAAAPAAVVRRRAAPRGRLRGARTRSPDCRRDDGRGVSRAALPGRRRRTTPSTRCCTPRARVRARRDAFVSRFELVSNSVWNDEPFCSLSAAAKFLFLWSFLNPLCSMSGVYKVRPQIVALDTGLAPDDITRALGELEDAGMVRFERGVMWCCARVKHLRGGGPTMARSIARDIAALSSEHPIRVAFLERYAGFAWLRDELRPLLIEGATMGPSGGHEGASPFPVVEGNSDAPTRPPAGGPMPLPLPGSSRVDDDAGRAREAEDEVWAHYLAAVHGDRRGGVRPTFDDRRRGIVRAALKVRDLEQCKRAIDGLARSPHHRGENSSAPRTTTSATRCAASGRAAKATKNASTAWPHSPAHQCCDRASGRTSAPPTSSPPRRRHGRERDLRRRDGARHARRTAACRRAGRRAADGRRAPQARALLPAPAPARLSRDRRARRRPRGDRRQHRRGSPPGRRHP